MAYWYNLRTRAVETDEQRSADAEVMGPYESAEAASRALQTAAERTEAWDEADRRWAEEG